MEERLVKRKIQARKIISCPFCKYQYLPGEVLEPDQVLGQPKAGILRDPIGKILFEEYKPNREPLAEDTFYCDNCGKPFVIEINLDFKVKEEEPELDFSETSEVSLW